MLNPTTMTAEQEQQARDQAFYLLKKYTSYTFLDRARQLQQDFVDAIERQLRNPPAFPPGSQDALRMHARAGETIGYFENDYRTMLDFMAPKEEGLRMLLAGEKKRAAHTTFLVCPPPGMIDHLFGRRADYQGSPHESLFYQALGARSHLPGDMVNPLHTGYMQGTIEGVEMESALSKTRGFGRTVAPFYLLDSHTQRKSEKWTYETLFFEPQWPIPRVFPAQLPPCPPHNTNAQGEVWSGKEISLDGIWEPWLLSGKVGCPNYFFAGAVATEYNLEGTTEWEHARWRLLWQDKRYLDGRIPPEEALYFAQPAPVAPPQTILSAQPGQVVPRAGVWQTPAMLERRTLTMSVGEKLPYATQDKSGNAVVWFWRGEK
ncbi:MAG: Imm72 family immunity protein [Rhodoferax sp.]|nr:Imm72 family immunity protein [Rhodoferax sp.]